MKLHHLAFRTQELERLEAFYRQVLDLPVVRRQEGYSVWLGLETAVLMLEQAGDEPVPDGASLELAAFRVNDDARQRIEGALSQRGIEIEDRTGYTLYFRDPDGRRIAVSTYPLDELS